MRLLQAARELWMAFALLGNGRPCRICRVAKWPGCISISNEVKDRSKDGKRECTTRGLTALKPAYTRGSAHDVDDIVRVNS